MKQNMGINNEKNNIFLTDKKNETKFQIEAVKFHLCMHILICVHISKFKLIQRQSKQSMLHVIKSELKKILFVAFARN
jgi:hypothetical protein